MAKKERKAPGKNNQGRRVRDAAPYDHFTMVTETKQKLFSDFIADVANETSKNTSDVGQKLKAFFATADTSSEKGREKLMNEYDNFMYGSLGVTSEDVADRLYPYFCNLISPQEEDISLRQIIIELDPHVERPILLDKKEMLLDFLAETEMPEIDPKEYKRRIKKFNDALVAKKALKLGQLKGLIGLVRDQHPEIHERLHAVFNAYAEEPEASETEDLRSQKLPKTPRNANSDPLEEGQRQLFLEQLEEIIKKKKALKSELVGHIGKHAIIKERLTETREKEIETLMKLLPNRKELLKAFGDYRNVHKTTRRERNRYLREKIIGKTSYRKLVSEFNHYVDEKVAVNNRRLEEYAERLKERKEIFEDLEKGLNDKINTYYFVQSVVQEYYNYQYPPFEKSFMDRFPIFRKRMWNGSSKRLKAIVNDTYEARKMGDTLMDQKEIDAALEHYKKQHPQSSVEQLEQHKKQITKQHRAALRKGINAFVKSQVGDPIKTPMDKKARKKHLENSLAELSEGIKKYDELLFILEGKSFIINGRGPRKTVGVPPPPIVPEPKLELEQMQEQLDEKWRQYTEFENDYDTSKPNRFKNLFSAKYRDARKAKRRRALDIKYHSLNIQHLENQIEESLKDDPEHKAKRLGYTDDPGPGGKSAGQKMEEALQELRDNEDAKVAQRFLPDLLFGNMDKMPEIPMESGGIQRQLSARSSRSGWGGRGESRRRPVSAKVYPSAPPSPGGSLFLGGAFSAKSTKSTPVSHYFGREEDERLPWEEDNTHTPVLLRIPRFGDSKPPLHTSSPHSSTSRGIRDMGLPDIAEAKDPAGHQQVPIEEEGPRRRKKPTMGDQNPTATDRTRPKVEEAKVPLPLEDIQVSNSRPAEAQERSTKTPGTQKRSTTSRKQPEVVGTTVSSIPAQKPEVPTAQRRRRRRNDTTDTNGNRSKNGATTTSSHVEPAEAKPTRETKKEVKIQVSTNANGTKKKVKPQEAAPVEAAAAATNVEPDTTWGQMMKVVSSSSEVKVDDVPRRRRKFFPEQTYVAAPDRAGGIGDSSSRTSSPLVPIDGDTVQLGGLGQFTVPEQSSLFTEPDNNQDKGAKDKPSTSTKRQEAKRRDKVARRRRGGLNNG